MTLSSKHVYALLLSLGLAACGGGGSESPATHGTPPGGTSEQPPPDYSEHYPDLGVEPEIEEDGLSADEAVRSAVPIGYVGIGTLIATLDLRMALQAYEWAVPAAVDAHVGVEPPYSHPCQSGEMVVHGRADGVTEFDFGNCVATSGAKRLHSDPSVESGVQRFQQFSADLFRFDLDGVQLLDENRADEDSVYHGFTFSGGPLVREWIDRNTLEMTWSNAMADEAPGTLAFAGSRASVSLRGADLDEDTASVIRTWKEAGSERLRFDIPHLSILLEREGSDLAGGYVLRTVEPLDLAYTPQVRLAGGSFQIERDSGATYTYSVDADPAYLHVEVDEDGDGEVDATGRISQALVTQRLNLAE